MNKEEEEGEMALGGIHLKGWLLHTQEEQSRGEVLQKTGEKNESGNGSPSLHSVYYLAFSDHLAIMERVRPWNGGRNRYRFLLPYRPIGRKAFSEKTCGDRGMQRTNGLLIILFVSCDLKDLEIHDFNNNFIGFAWTSDVSDRAAGGDTQWITPTTGYRLG